MADKPFLGLSPGGQIGIAVVLLVIAAGVLYFTGVIGGRHITDPPPTLSGTWVIDQASWPKFQETIAPFGRQPVEDLLKANLAITMTGDKQGDFTTKTVQGETKTTYEVTYTGSGVLSIKLAKADPTFTGQVSFQRPKGPGANPEGMIVRWGTGMAMPLRKK